MHEGRELDREAQAHMALAVLLRKQRPSAKREAVRRILQSERTTSQIVEAIRRLDAQSEVEETKEEEFTREESAEELPRPAHGPSPFRLSLPKLRSVLKVPRVPTPFFRYLFHEYPRMSLFGRATHVFSPIFLFPVLRLESTIPRLFAETLAPWANEILAFLAPILLVGWKHLSKKEYNMIVALDRLCREITTVNLRLFSSRDRNLIDKLRSLETLFFAFHYHSESADEVSRAVESVMSKEPEMASKAHRSQVMISRLLQPELTMPSLFNVLLGLNMLKTRKSLTLSDLLTQDLGELFETQTFACDPAIEAQIRAMIEELRNKILRLHLEWTQLKRYKELLGIGDRDVPTYIELRRLYEQGASPLQPRNLDADRQNVMDFAPTFFRRFESSCYPLLGGGVRLDAVGRVEIFSGSTFQNELDRLRLTASKLERAAFGFRSFPYSRYTSIKREGKGGISTELEVIARLDEASSALVGIGKRLERVLARDASAPQVLPEEQAMRPAAPIDSAAIASGRPFALPHRSRLVAGSTWLGGKSVSDAVAAVAAACFQCAYYLQDLPFIETVASERAIYQHMSAQMEIMRRLTDPSTYDQLVTALLHTAAA